MYSFIAPRKKASIDTFTYMWILFIVITSVFLIGIGLYIESENNKYDMYKTDLINKIETNKKIKQALNKDILTIKEIYKKEQEVKLSNNSLSNGIKNLLSFIPDQIILNKMILGKYEIKLYGYIDSPKTYKLLLEPPLKSIFDTTKVGFTKIDDDKYMFSSYNKIKRVDHEKE